MVIEVANCGVEAFFAIFGNVLLNVFRHNKCLATLLQINLLIHEPHFVVVGCCFFPLSFHNN
jgi:hypothetical protein